MNAEIESARDNLAYMRALVGGTERMQKTIGEAFFWAGLLYGGQCFLHWLQTLRILPDQGLVGLAVVVVPTVIFVGILTLIIIKDGKTPQGGPASRALGSVFQGAGIANLVMAFVFAYGAQAFDAPGFGSITRSSCACSRAWPGMSRSTCCVSHGLVLSLWDGSRRRLRWAC
jgi:hypothetical protein